MLSAASDARWTGRSQSHKSGQLALRPVQTTRPPCALGERR